MTTTLGIIGLGQIGASIGLVLRRKGVSEKILGHDRDTRVAREAVALGAIGAAAGFKEVASQSDILFLCIPLGEMHTVLGKLGSLLRPGAVIVETAPIKAGVNLWIQELLPPGIQHVGLVPGLSPALLGRTELGIKAAHDELFQRTIMMVVTSRGSSEATEQLGLNLARLLGAKPMLIDQAEADGIMTTAHVLPQLAASALIEASMGSGGWMEARKLAGRPFVSVTGGMAYYDDPASVEAEVAPNPDRVAHGLDVLIAALGRLRDDIAAQDGGRVRERLEHNFRARERWLDERNAPNWLAEGPEPVEMPGAGEQLTRLLFGGRIAEASRAHRRRPAR